MGKHQDRRSGELWEPLTEHATFRLGIDYGFRDAFTEGRPIPPDAYESYLNTPRWAYFRAPSYERYLRFYDMYSATCRLRATGLSEIEAAEAVRRRFDPVVVLTTPQDGQKVPCSNIAKGTYPLDFKDYIWPVVYVSGRYYPQATEGKAAQKNSGNWYQPVRFGDCNDPKEDGEKPFQLIIVTANELANAEFEKYEKAGQASRNWRGMVELPQGTIEQVRLSVTRQ